MKFFRKKKKDERVYLMCVDANELVCFEVDNALGAIRLFDEGYPIVVEISRCGNAYTLTICKKQLDSRFDDYYFYKDTEILYRRKNRDEYGRSVDENSKVIASLKAEMEGGKVMKQGTVVNRGTKPDTLEWLQETIDMLSRYKAEVEAGEIVVTSGDTSVTSPVPEIDRITEKCVSISFDYRVID